MQFFNEITESMFSFNLNIIHLNVILNYEINHILKSNYINYV